MTMMVGTLSMDLHIIYIYTSVGPLFDLHGMLCFSTILCCISCSGMMRHCCVHGGKVLE